MTNRLSSALVVGSGHSTVDHLCVVHRHPRLDGKQPLLRYETQPGGQVPTALVALRRWGMPVAYVGVFGDDPGGLLVRSALAREGVNLHASVVLRNQSQPVSVILVDRATGERSVLAGPCGDPFRLPVVPSEILKGARFLLLDAVDPWPAIESARRAKEFGVQVVLDVDQPTQAINELLALTDVLIASRDFFFRLTGDDRIDKAVEKVARLGPWLVGATLGTGGAVARAEERTIFVPAYRVLALDTTGAGDLFHAGCIHGLLQGWPIEKTLRFAAASAALKCRKFGGRAGIPSLEEVRALMSDQAAEVSRRKTQPRGGRA